MKTSSTALKPPREYSAASPTHPDAPNPFSQGMPAQHSQIQTLHSEPPKEVPLKLDIPAVPPGSLCTRSFFSGCPSASVVASSLSPEAGFPVFGQKESRQKLSQRDSQMNKYHDISYMKPDFPNVQGVGIGYLSS